MSTSIGYWTPSAVIGDVQAIAERIRTIVGPTSQGFPFALSPVRDEKNMTVASYGVIRGHVPIHVDRPNAHEVSSCIFMFVLETENRPVLLVAPASEPTSKAILMPDEVRVPRTAFGALELTAGRAVHFDVARNWHGITGYPTGDVVADLPEAIVIQVPWARADDIQGAVAAMQRAIRLDDRFADLVTPVLED